MRAGRRRRYRVESISVSIGLDGKVTDWRVTARGDFRRRFLQ
jgi:hypothetical protein